MDAKNTILVPVDFRVASLNTLRLALETNVESRVNVILCYCECINDSITDLVFYSPFRRINELMSPDFKEALAILKNRFEKKIVNVTIELFHGRTQGAFNNFVYGRKVDNVYIPKSYKLHLRSGAFNPIDFIKKGPVSFYEMDWLDERRVVENDQLESLFIRNSEWEKQPPFQLHPQAE